MYPGADVGEDEAPETEDEEAGQECDDTDGAEGGIQFNGKVEKGGEQQKIFKW